MAFKMALELNNGIFVKSSYARIERIDGNKENVNAFLVFYKDKNSLDEGKEALCIKNYICNVSTDVDAKNFIQQVYQQLKLLEEFSDAINV